MGWVVVEYGVGVYLLYPIIFVFSNNKKTIVLLWMLCVFISSSLAKVQAEPIEIYVNILSHMVFLSRGSLSICILRDCRQLDKILGSMLVLFLA